MAMSHFQLQLVSCNNLFPLEDQPVAVYWKGKKKTGGNSPTVVVKQAKAAFVGVVFDVAMEAAKKGGRLPVLLTIHTVLPSKKTKEVAACELNLADFTEKKPQPYAVRIKVEWRIKIAKAYESALAGAAADIILRIDPVAAPSPAPSPRLPPPPAAEGRRSEQLVPVAVTSALSRRVEQSEPESDDDPVTGALPDSSVERERTADREEDASNPFGAAPAAPQPTTPSMNNPFASLSRRVGGGGSSAASGATGVGVGAAPAPEEPPSLSVTSGSGTSFPALDDRSETKDVRKLQAENRKLRQEMERLEEKRADAAKKLAQAQAKIKQLEKAVPKASMKELRREGYQQSTDSAPSAAEAGGQVVADSIVAVVRSHVSNANSMNEAVYWLAWGCGLHAALARDMGASVASIQEHGVDTKRTEPVGSIGSTKQFLQALDVTIAEAYRRAVFMVEGEIRVLVEKKARNYWDVEVESNAIGAEVVDLFDRWVVVMIHAQVPSSVLNQWLFQTLYHLSASIFNSFLSHPSLCDPAVALQIKMYLSELENWGSGRSSVLYNWRSFKVQLQPLVDLSNVLLVDKKNLSSSMLKEAAPSLSIHQVKLLLDMFGSYAKEHERVPAAVMREISDAAGMDSVPIDKALIRERTFDLHDLVSAKPTAH